MKGPLAGFGSATDFLRRDQVSSLRGLLQQDDGPLASRSGEVVHDVFGNLPASLGAGRSLHVYERIDGAAELRGPLFGPAGLEPRRQGKRRDLRALLQPLDELGDERIGDDWLGHGITLAPTLPNLADSVNELGEKSIGAGVGCPNE